MRREYQLREGFSDHFPELCEIQVIGYCCPVDCYIHILCAKVFF
jgi:hypothetical protein